MQLDDASIRSGGDAFERIGIETTGRFLPFSQPAENRAA
jgi:hypothetical protein